MCMMLFINHSAGVSISQYQLMKPIPSVNIGKVNKTHFVKGKSNISLGLRRKLLWVENYHNVTDACIYEKTIKTIGIFNSQLAQQSFVMI